MMQPDSKPLDPETAFRALADRTRLRILNMLHGREVCVCDIVDILKIPQPKATWHLNYLRMSRLVSGRKQDKWTFYRLTPVNDEFHRTLLAALWTSISTMSDLAADVARWTDRGPGRCGLPVSLT
jgi:ArsR family transcriptional regulator